MPPKNLFPLSLPPQFLAPRLAPSNTTKQQLRTLRSITRQRPSRFNLSPTLPVLTSTTAAALERKARTTPLRTGLLGVKKGMSAVYDSETGRRAPVTLVQLDRVQVVGHKTRPRHGYWAVQVGLGYRHPSNVTRALLGTYAKHELAPKRETVEFKVKDEKGLLPVGSLLPPSWFAEGQFVDAKSNCKGKGFAGGMKRHGFHGQPASHGVSLTHRSMGSAGQSQGGGSRVYPGKRMPGRMGGQQVTVPNVKVVKVDDDNGILVLHGK